MSVDLHQGPIDPQKNVYRDMLSNLQGNILKPHGRSHAIHIFLKFKADKDAVRRWMRAFAKDYVTSAEQQLKELSDFRTHRTLKLFGNLFLSAAGYEALGYAKEDIKRAFAVAQEDRERHLTILEFSKGMKTHTKHLNDPCPEKWDTEYKDRIDAMILLADTDEAFMLRQSRTVLDEVAAVADVVTIERGHALRNNCGDPIEPFGYVDGISQPVFLQDNTQAAPTMWDPSASLDLVLLPDPFAKTPDGKALPDCFGSYLVFRKLEQNLREFRKRIELLAHDLRCTDDMAHALVLGRFKDGTPLSLSDKAGMSRSAIDDFNYSQDPGGTKCPFHAHIRRLNPRHESAANLITVADDEAERRHRIARRSIPYGVSSEVTRHDYPVDQLPTGGAGILFMCFQRSLSNQFGYLQTVWANSGTRSDGTQVPIGVDPIIGQPDANQLVTEQPRWPKQWGELDFQCFDFQGFVTLKGGEFLFAPSPPFFQRLTHPTGTGQV